MNKRIFTFGDGQATGHIWPEWPQVLEALFPEYEIINSAAIGGGNEILVTKFVNLIDKMKDSYVVFQWPRLSRFDKLVEDTTWETIGLSDEVYAFNFITEGKYKWWISSKSGQEDVRRYHEHYIQPKQATQREYVYKKLVSNTLQNLGCVYRSIEVSEEAKFSNRPFFKHTKQNEIQPSPVVHYYFVIECILPKLNIFPLDERNAIIKNRIEQHTWKPYDIDREAIYNWFIS